MLLRPLDDQELNPSRGSGDPGPQTLARWLLRSCAVLVKAAALVALSWRLERAYEPALSGGGAMALTQPMLIVTTAFLLAGALLQVLDSRAQIRRRSVVLGREFAWTVRGQRNDPKVAVMVRTSHWWPR